MARPRKKQPEGMSSIETVPDKDVSPETCCSSPQTEKEKRSLSVQRKYILQKRIDEYFTILDETGRRPCISALRRAMGYKTAKQLTDDIEVYPEIGELYESAVERVDEYHERNLFSTACQGSIFYLKNRGWSDKQEVKHNGGITVKITTYGD